MLTNFSVTGFRNFENELNFDFSSDADYDFNLECIKDGMVKTAIIYGQNGSGKSNLGLAITDIRDLLYNSDISSKDKSLFLNGNLVDELIKFKYNFKFEDNYIEVIYFRDKKAQLTYEELSINNVVIYKYDHNQNLMIQEKLAVVGADTLNFTVLSDNLSETKKISVLSYIYNNAIVTVELLNLIKYIENIYYMNTINATPNRIYEFIIEKDLIKDFNDFMSDFNIHDEIVKATTVSGEEIVAIKYNDKNIPFTMCASSGTQALAKFYYWYKNTDKINFLYLDEFDAYYHFEISQKLIELLKDRMNLQVVFTTHNTNLLTNNLLRPDCYFVLGNNKITPLNKATRRELDEGHNLERLYLGGEFND